MTTDKQVRDPEQEMPQRGAADALTAEPAGKNKKNAVISANRAWAYVFIGGALEIVWASGFKYEAVPVFVVLAALLVSFDLVIRATKVLPIGTTYAVFTGIGTVGMVAVEAVAERGNISLVKIGLVLVLLLFIIGLKLTSGKEEKR